MKFAHSLIAGLMLCTAAAANAVPQFFSAVGVNPAAIKGTVDAFRNALGPRTAERQCCRKLRQRTP